MKLTSLTAIFIAACLPPHVSAASTKDVGEVNFANSGAAGAQEEFLRAMAQLHNFEYDDSAGHFRKAQSIDPDFAMAYWGEAMTKNHAIWHQQDREGAREVLIKLGPSADARSTKAKTLREKAYLHAVEVLYGDGSKDDRDSRYCLEMAQLARQFPDDVDAIALYALSILGTAENGRDFATYMRAAAVLEEVFPAHPRHPGVVHYLIHSYDDPIHAPLGLRAARIYSQIAPDAGHAQHMTSHIYLALGMWDDVIKANETAIGVVNQHRRSAGKSEFACGHYGEWLEYSYLQRARIKDAREVLRRCRAEALQEVNDAKHGKTMDPGKSIVGSFSEMRANFIVNSQLWKDEVVDWTFPESADEGAHMTFTFATAFARLKGGDKARAIEAVEQFEGTRKAFDDWFDKQQESDPLGKKRADILSGQLSALVLEARGKGAEALALLRPLALEERQMPIGYGPPMVNKPVEELIGEILFKQGDFAGARRSFQSALAGAPERIVALQGMKMVNVGDGPRGKGTSGL
jgi:tetratricopeptide (TPR) repeat protein